MRIVTPPDLKLSFTDFVDHKIRRFSFYMGILSAFAITFGLSAIFFYTQAGGQKRTLLLMSGNIATLMQNSDYREVERTLSSFVKSYEGSELKIVKSGITEISLPELSGSGKLFDDVTTLKIGDLELDKHGHIVSKIDLLSPVTHSSQGVLVFKTKTTSILIQTLLAALSALVVIMLVFQFWRRQISTQIRLSLEPMRTLHKDLLTVGNGGKPRTSPNDYAIKELGDFSQSVCELSKNIDEMTVLKAKAEGERSAKEAVRSLLHDLANPVTVLSTLIQTMCLRPNDKDAHSLLVKRWPSIQDQILTLMSAGKRVEVERPRLTIDSLETATHDGAKAGAISNPNVLKLKMQNGEPVSHDPVLLSRAIANLVRNSIEAGAKNVKVWNDKRKIHVEDDGPGIPSEAVPALFEGRLKSQKPFGSGIGFPTALRLVNAQKGRLFLIKNSPIGCHFVVDFSSQFSGSGEA